MNVPIAAALIGCGVAAAVALVGKGLTGKFVVFEGLALGAVVFLVLLATWG